MGMDELGFLDGSIYQPTRDYGSVKVVFFTVELSKKPIKYFANVGNFDKDSTLHKVLTKIKTILGIRLANNICYLSYYGGGRLVSPFHCHWMGDEFEFYVWDYTGEKTLLYIRRKAGEDEHFTSDEIKQISGVLEAHYHLVNKGYQYISSKIGNPTNYNDYFEKIKAMDLDI